MRFLTTRPQQDSHRARLAVRIIVATLVSTVAADAALAQSGGFPEGRRRPGRLQADRRPAGRRAAPVQAAAAPATAPADERPIPEGHPLLGVMEFAAESREALKEVRDYTAVFTKTELVGNRMVSQVMDIKLRQKPFSVYFRFRSGNEAGREVLYVAGANNGNVLVHESGIKAIAGTIPVRPNGREVMEENRYPITHVGIANLLESAYQIWESEGRVSNPDDVEVKYFPNAKLRNTPCTAVQITHKKPSRELKFHLSRVYFDKESKLPVRAERFGWPRRAGDKPPLVEEYTYSQLRTNVGLRDSDFNPRNPEYNFP